VPLLVLVLPLLHNVYYGHTWTWLPRSHDIRENLPLPVSALFRLNDPSVRAELLLHLQYLAHVGIADRPSLGVPFHALQLVYVVTVIAWWSRVDSPARVESALVLLVPVVTLSVHLFFQVHTYYPRHIMLGYLLIGASSFGAMAFAQDDEHSR
jgi:hypothetical protein